MMKRAVFISTILALLVLLVGACNLTSSPEEPLSLTEIPTTTGQPTRTVQPTGGIPTTLPLTQSANLPTQTRIPIQLAPTTLFLPPTTVFLPTSTPLPVSIVILSPIPGNIIAGNVQVLGAAIHPLFLQYQLEYGPDPNPSNLWYPATGIVQTPVLNGLLGIWNTNTSASPDGQYQLRLRVTLRDGTSLSTFVNAIRIQNRVPTPVPSNTPPIPRPIAAFSPDRTSGLAPLVVRFINQSSGTISAYNWSFGDGTSSAEVSPTYTYRLPGLYNVTLTVTGPGGQSNVTRQINVQGAAAPVAGFTQDKTSGPSPLSVKFTDQSTGNITSYNWVFGDGATSSERNPTHQFVAVGTYNVILTVTGPGGSSSVTRKITVEDPVKPPPVARFNANPQSGMAPLTVQFMNESTGEITAYAWDFGDGGTGTDTNPIYTFRNAGNFVVRLTAIGPGGQNTAEGRITVTQPPAAPVAAFTADPTAGTAPLAVQFTNQSSGDITSILWDFGDGLGSSADPNPAYTYDNPGTYTARLTVTGPGGSAEAQAVITVAAAPPPPAAPVAAFTADPTAGTAPLAVQFTNQSSGDITSILWDFGDGLGSSADPNPAYTYDNPGTYTARLTVTGPGGSAEAQAVITVAAAPPPPAAPVAAFTADPTAGTAPLAVQFTNQSSGDITNILWDFGDGLGSSADPNPAYTYDNPGTYTARLTVTGPGGSAEAQAVITVAAAPPPPPTPDAPIAFVSNRDGNNEIYIMATDGTLTNVTGNPADDGAPNWSPDGGRIAFVSNREGRPQIYVMNADGTGVQRLSDLTADDSAPAWSPDGGRIAFVSNREGRPQIYVMNADGTGVQRLSDLTADDSAPAWSPDGGRVAFVSNREGRPQIYVMNADGTGVQRLSDLTADDSAPAWSPDGGRIAFVSNRDGNAEVYLMNADGTNLINLSNDAAQDFDPSWLIGGSPRIAFVTDRDGNSEIYIMNADGSNQLNLTSSGAEDTSPHWQP